MNYRIRKYRFLFFCSVLFLCIQQWSCHKEYSYEGVDVSVLNDSTVQHDSVPQQTLINSCSFCQPNAVMSVGSWNFINNHSYYCGSTTNAGFIGSASTFTFFGPSACSIDTGLVITVYLPQPFDGDMYNVTSNNIAFYYYDHKDSTDMFIKLPPLNFSLTVQSYIKATGIATGTFTGDVYKANGDTTTITNGRFTVKLK